MNRAPARRQHGVVMFISLIILVAMTLAGIALMRSVDTGTIIAGNLAFRQNTTYVGDIGVEAARAWLTLPATTAVTLWNDATGNAYAIGRVVESVPGWGISGMSSLRPVGATSLSVVLGTFGALYLALTLALGVAEARGFATRITARLRRG